MHNHPHRCLSALLAFVLCASTAVAAEPFEPTAMFLTWQRDPTSTMTIDWQLTPEQHADAARHSLEHRKLGEDAWQARDADVAMDFPFSDRRIKRVELTQLEPASTYEFRFGEGSRVYRFRTMPLDAAEPIRFATGGDTRHTQEWMERTNRQAMRFDPDFIVWGGDFAYADGREDRVHHWYEWFDAIMNTLIDDDGRVVPVVGVIGNHEMHGHQYYNHEDVEFTPEWREQVAPYFYRFFAFPGQPGYNVLDFGDYLSLIVLDSAHTNRVEGEQTQWLEKVLAERQHVAHLLPVYHVPAFPSHRSYGTAASQMVLHNWVPLFEEHGVRLAFENNDHTYKRTHPVRDARVIQPDDREPDADYHWVAGGIHSMVGEIDRTHGIVYVGDGAWGVGDREVLNTPENTWYMAKAQKARHLIMVTLHNAHQHLLVVDEHGNVIDEYPATPTRDALLREATEVDQPAAEPGEGE